MEALRKLYAQTSEFFYQNYPLITLMSCFVALFTAYLHYELSVNKNDLMYWKQISELISRDLDYYHLVLLTGVVLINFCFLVIIMFIYMRPISDTADLTLLEIKDRYVRFIMLRLIARLDRIQTKLALKCNKSKDLYAYKETKADDVVHAKNMALLRNYMRAHDNMAKAVALFRKDVRKVIAPSETEIMLPIEDVFCVAEEEERALRRAGYYKLPIEFTDDIMKSLLNPLTTTTAATTTPTHIPLRISAGRQRERQRN